MPMPVLIAMHGYKGHVALNFNHLDIRNAKVPLVSTDALTNASDMM